MEHDELNYLLLKAKQGDNEAVNNIYGYFRNCCNDIILEAQCRLYTKDEILADIDMCTFNCYKLYKTSYIYNFYCYTRQSIKNCVYRKLRSLKKYTNDISFENCIYDGDATLENFIRYDENIYKPFEDKVCFKLDFNRLKQIILTLKPDDIEVLNFIVLEHHSYEEYSDLKSKSLNSVYQQYHRAEGRLKIKCYHYGFC